MAQLLEAFLAIFSGHQPLQSHEINNGEETGEDNREYEFQIQNFQANEKNDEKCGERTCNAQDFPELCFLFCHDCIFIRLPNPRAFWQRRF